MKLKEVNKSKHVILFVMMILSPLMFSQTVQPRVDSVLHEGGLRECLVVNIDPEPKTVKKAWKSFLKEEYEFKIKGIGFLRNKELLYKEGIVIDKVSSKKLDFFTSVKEGDVGSEMKVFAAFGYDIYINKSEHKEEYTALREMLTKFLKSYLPDYHKNQVKETEKKVRKLEKKVSGLKKDISKNKDKIEDLSEEVEELSLEVEKKEANLEIANTKLEERRKKLVRIKEELKGL